MFSPQQLQAIAKIIEGFETLEELAKEGHDCTFTVSNVYDEMATCISEPFAFTQLVVEDGRTDANVLTLLDGTMIFTDSKDQATIWRNANDYMEYYEDPDEWERLHQLSEEGEQSSTS